MASYTLTYNENSKGWPSFYSYHPEFIRGMNTYLYTFSGGNLWRHNTNNNRNEYYGVAGNLAPSTITSVFNPQPVKDIKLFKTLSYESNAAWDCTALTSDLSQGNVGEIYFEQKEGEWFSYIRHDDGVTDFTLRYTNGIAACTVAGGQPAAATVCTFTVDIGHVVTIGALAYTLVNGQAPVIAGTITAIDRNNNSITIDTTTPAGPPAPTAPVTGDFIMYTNNTVAESYGMRGYYMEFTLSNNDTTAVELFSVGSSVMKSYP
jgi:hypothetical protein